MLHLRFSWSPQEDSDDDADGGSGSGGSSDSSGSEEDDDDDDEGTTGEDVDNAAGSKQVTCHKRVQLFHVSDPHLRASRPITGRLWRDRAIAEWRVGLWRLL